MWPYIAPLLSALAAAGAVFVAMRNTNRTLTHQTTLQGEQRTWERREILYSKMLKSIDQFMEKATDTSVPVKDSLTAEDFFVSQFTSDDLEQLRTISDQVRLIASSEVCELWNEWMGEAQVLMHSSIMARFANPVGLEDGTSMTTKEAHREQLDRGHEIASKLTSQARHDLLFAGSRRFRWRKALADR